MSIQLTTRNATLQDAFSLLSVQHDAKLDGNVPSEAIESRGGVFHVSGLGLDGPAGPPGLFIPTEGADGDIASRLEIPTLYLRRLREKRIDLYDANINGWLHGVGPEDHRVAFGTIPPFDPDPRSHLLRCFTDPDGGPGVLRAVLSDRYNGALDNLDAATAILTGIRETGVNAHIVGCDISERRMVIKVAAPDVFVLAPDFLKNYRNPFPRQQWVNYATRHGIDPDAYDGKPIVFAGFIGTNSETGGGAWSITPRIGILECLNGATRNAEAFRAVHLGGKLEEGVVNWSDETRIKTLDLVTSKTKDAISTFLSTDYLQGVVDETTEKAVKRLENPAEAVQLVSNKLKFTEEQTKGVFDFFIKGGQTTAGGLFQAVTAYAQSVNDPDVAFDFEAAAFAALDEAAKIAV